MRLPVAVLVLALAACTPAAPRPRTTATPPPAPVASPSRPPAGIYLTTTPFTPNKRWVASFLVQHARKPTLHGLPAPVLRQANTALAAAVGHEVRLAWEDIYYGDTYGSGVLWVDPEIAAVDYRYVTVDLLVTHVYGDDSFYDVTPVVLDRRTGRRIAADSMLTAAGHAEVLAYARTRLFEVTGRRTPVNQDVYRYSLTEPHRYTPLPEGLQAAADGWVLGIEHDDPLVVVVPWARLAPYLRITPPRGDRDPAYRDGRRPRDAEAGLMRAALRPNEAVTRLELDQYAADRHWVLGTTGTGRVLLHQAKGTWRVAERGPDAGCRRLPEPVRVSFALRCPPPPVTVTTTALGNTQFDEYVTWHARVPTLHGLAPAVARRANAGLAAAIDDLATGEGAYLWRGEEPASELWIDGELAATTDRYVTVDLLVTVRGETDTAHYDVDPYVVDRATGARVTLAGMVRPAAYGVIASYVTQRLHQVRGEPAPVISPSARDLSRVTPLPEGLQVAVTGLKLRAPGEDPAVVVVPWARLAPYLRITPPAGDREPAYRDGRRLAEWEAALVAKALRPGEVLTRLEADQYVADRHWAIGTSGRARVVLHEADGRWRVVERGRTAGCTTLPAPVRASFALRCG